MSHTKGLDINEELPILLYQLKLTISKSIKMLADNNNDIDELKAMFFDKLNVLIS